MSDVLPSEVTLPQVELSRMVLCAGCQHALTSPKHAIEMGGCHEHTFRNPAAYSYHVVCYAEAPGCLRAGEPTAEASWFPGCAWSFALCGGCHQHVGWHYVGARSFWGLIATRLLR